MASRKLYRELAWTIKHLLETNLNGAKNATSQTARSYLEGVSDGIRLSAMSIASDLKQDNMNFSRVKFLDACGVDDWSHYSTAPWRETDTETNPLG